MRTERTYQFLTVAVALMVLSCAHAFQDTTNFTGPELRDYKKIVVLPFSSGKNYIDEYYVESIEKHWPKIKVVPLEKLLQKFKLKEVQSNRVNRTTLREIREQFEADVVIKGTINSHYFAPLYPKDNDTRMTIHLTVYLVDLNSFETVACYHNEGWRRAFHNYRGSDPEKYYKSLSSIASGNVKGLVQLARSSGHL